MKFIRKSFILEIFECLLTPSSLFKRVEVIFVTHAKWVSVSSDEEFNSIVASFSESKRILQHREKQTRINVSKNNRLI